MEQALPGLPFPPLHEVAEIQWVHHQRDVGQKVIELLRDALNSQTHHRQVSLPRTVRSKTDMSYLKFSELNSDSRNLRNCSLPTGSFRASSMPNPHRFTLCWLGSLLEEIKRNQTHSFHYRPYFLLLHFLSDLCMSCPPIFISTSRKQKNLRLMTLHEIVLGCK